LLEADFDHCLLKVWTLYIIIELSVPKLFQTGLRLCSPRWKGYFIS